MMVKSLKCLLTLPGLASGEQCNWLDYAACQNKTLRSCVGVWDTVGQVLNTVNALGIDDAALPASVDCALHAMSMHENRQWYLPTLWEIPETGLSKLPDGTMQVYKEVL